MVNFRIKEIKDCEYKYMVFSTCYISPTEDLETLETVLSRVGCNNKVIFDLLFCSGNNFNRFCEANFNGVNFDISSFAVVEDVPLAIREESDKFYKDNAYLIEDSIFSSW